MSSDKETISVYEARASDYARVTADSAADPLLARFIAAMPAGARVLDLGSGPGIAAAKMAARGLDVVACDASPAMVAAADRRLPGKVLLRSFETFPTEPGFQGIWANFSLLHAPRADMPRHLARIRSALLSGGLVHVALKRGTGEARDRLGRFYSYYEPDELQDLLRAAGFTPRTLDHGADPGLDGTVSPWFAISADG